MKKPLAFISYIHEDEHFAIGLRDWIREALLEGLEFFVAGDRGSIPLGSEWPKEISNALRRCAVAILILSPQSIDRKWIYFEAGAAFARKISVIPVCCNGLVKTDLTPPLSFLQAVQLPNRADETLLLAELAKLCGLKSPKNPPFLELKEHPAVPLAEPKKETNESGILNFLFDQNRPSELILEWRDKIIEKVDQLQASGINLADAKEKLKTYLQRLTQEREKYVREGEKQIKTLPEKMKQEHPEGGLNVALGIAGTTMAFSGHIKASQALLEVLPELVQLCGESDITLEIITESIKLKFKDLLFMFE